MSRIPKVKMVASLGTNRMGKLCIGTRVQYLGLEENNLVDLYYIFMVMCLMEVFRTLELGVDIKTPTHISLRKI